MTSNVFGNMGSAFETLRRSGLDPSRFESALKRTQQKRERVDQQVGVISRSRMVCALPLKKTKSFMRSNDKVEMELICSQRYGVPFGKFGRLIFAWLDTQICYKSDELKKNGNVIELKATANELAALVLHGPNSGKTVSGKQMRDFNSNWKSVCNMMFSVRPKSVDATECDNLQIAESQKLTYRGKHNKISDHRNGYIKVSQKYVDHVLGRNPPIDLGYYASLTSAVDMDIYALTNSKLRSVEVFRTRISLNKNDLFMEIGPIAQTKLSKKKFFSKVRSVFDKYKNAPESPFEDFSWDENENCFVLVSGKSNVMGREERRKFRAFDQVEASNG